MVLQFHGIDLHKRFATISVRDNNGKEINFISCCTDIRNYISSLEKNDVVCVEAATGSFYWADMIEKQGATCHIIDPFKFKIIRDSWCKTDKKDAKSLSLAIWMQCIAHECTLPTIYKPAVEIRQYKNAALATLHDSGVILTEAENRQLFNPKKGLDMFDTFSLDQASKICVLMNIYLIWNIHDQKEILKREIYKAGTPFKEEIKLLVTIKGITAFLALAFISDVDDITRFSNVRGFNAYLGVAPSIKASGGKSRIGNINKKSRSLSRTMFTQSIPHLVNNSPLLQEQYNDLKARRGIDFTPFL